ncbi:hypothetical protein Lser_V15G08308 [Lactuca serriola]
MSTTVDDVAPPHSGKPPGGDAYIFVVAFFCIILLLITITYASNICKRPRSPPPPIISFGATSTTFDVADSHHLISFSRGLDDDVLVTFPTFLYSEVTIPHKGATDSCDTATDASTSGCSICLADYKSKDVVRLLPECGHLFHVKCIDTWLKAHPTCPMCRKELTD